MLGVPPTSKRATIAPAWLALSCVTAANYGIEAAATTLPRGESAARRAVALDPDDPVAHTAFGLVTLNFHFRADEAIASYRKAIELAPSFASAWQFLAEAWSVSGHHPEAIAAADQAVELEPFSPVVHAVRGLVLQAARRPQEALEALDQALLLDPRFTWVHRYRGHALTRLGRKRAAAFVAEVQGWGEHGEELAKLERLVAERDLTGYWEWRLAQLLAMREQGGAPKPT